MEVEMRDSSVRGMHQLTPEFGNSASFKNECEGLGAQEQFQASRATCQTATLTKGKKR